jgi:large subunit ribosomal protein L15
MKLHDLVPNPGSKKNRKRVGRGISAGQGKTAGRGTKGAGARSGEGGHLYRQGGNLPFYRRLPFIRGEGFTPPNQVTFNEVNLDQLSRRSKPTRKLPLSPWQRRVFCVIPATRSLFWGAVK